MSETEDDQRRRREDASIRLEQKFEDFLEATRIKEEAMAKALAIKDEESKLWRTSVDDRLNPLVDVYKILETPAKVMRVIVLLMVTPVAGMLGWGFIKKSVIWASHVLAAPR